MRSRAPVYVGLLLLEVATPWARSLKEKRSVVKPLAERLKTRFPVSVARLDGLDEHDWELLGVGAVSADAVWLEGVLSRARDFVHGFDLELRESRLDITPWELA